MAKYIPKIAQPVLNYVPSEGIENLTSYASKAMRLKILADRATRGFERVERKGGVNSYDFERTAAQSGNAEKEHRQQIVENVVNSRGNQPRKVEKDVISIIDIDYNPTDDLSKRRYKALELPFVPRELEYRPDSNFVGIASFGRNNPYYQFTGSEDTLSFEIDWFSNQYNRQDVIFNCRWLEALTKADGYDDIPHRVILSWGRDNLLWAGSEWLLTSAPYKLRDFVRGYVEKGTDTFVSTNMFPQQAYQRVTLKRLTTRNLSSQEIIGI